jgi:hypothetical protein
MRVNPEHRRTRDQTMRVGTAAVAGPALLYAGYKFPGSTGARGLLMLLGAALIYTNYETFRETFDGEEEEPEGDEEVPLGLLG